MKYTLDTAKQAATRVHTNKYDYSSWTAYTSPSKMISILCPEHGEFTQRISNHLAGSGCKQCGAIKKSKSLSVSPQTFIQNAMLQHGDKYDYSLWTIDNVGWHKKVPIICSAHGLFTQLLGSHIKGNGCKKCGVLAASAANTNSKAAYVAQAQGNQETQYDYSLVADNISNHVSIDIICPVHDVHFSTTWNQHITMCVKCPMCTVVQRQQEELEAYGVYHHKQRHLGPSTVNKLNDRVWMEYQYVTCNNTVAEIALQLECDVTTIHSYLNKHSIEIRTSCHTSTGEREILGLFNQTSHSIESNTRSIIHPLELDVYLPSAKLAIEYCGLYWHGDQYKANNYHAIKYHKCAVLGIQLITMYEDEWKNKADLVTTKLLYLASEDKSQAINGRSCQIRDVSLPNKAQFFDSSHVQGNGPSSINVGLYHNDVLVACMGLVSKINGVYLLNRYATSCNVRGGFTKLLSYFKKMYQWNIIETFADLRWSTGKLYANSGFTEAYRLPPDYYWTDGKVRHHKFGFRHTHIKTKFSNYNPDLTEDQNCRANKLWKIYDCGKIKYTITRITS